MCIRAIIIYHIEILKLSTGLFVWLGSVYFDMFKI